MKKIVIPWWMWVSWILMVMKPVEDFLRTKVIESDYIHMDLWSGVHFAAGYLLYSHFKFKPWLAITILVGYELLEPLAVPFVFRAERQLDTIWDVIWGISGYYTARRMLK